MEKKVQGVSIGPFTYIEMVDELKELLTFNNANIDAAVANLLNERTYHYTRSTRTPHAGDLHKSHPLCLWSSLPRR